MRSHVRVLAAAVLVSTVALSVPVMSTVAAASPRVASQPLLKPSAAQAGAKVLGWGLNRPGAVVDWGGRVWVVDFYGNNVIEFNAASGNELRDINGEGEFNEPAAIATNGVDVWVANLQGSFITEFSASSGALVRIIRGSHYGLSTPTGLVVDGSDLWVVNSEPRPGANDEVVTEVSVGTGALVRTVTVGRGYDSPGAIASTGSDIWVAETGQFTATANDLGRSVQELSASTGQIIRTLQGPTYGFDEPSALAVEGQDVWVANAITNSVTEFSAPTGAFVRRFTVRVHGRPVTELSDVSVEYGDVWLLNGSMISEVSAQSGKLMRRISGRRFNFDGPTSVVATGQYVLVSDTLGNSITELAAGTARLLRIVQGPQLVDTPQAIASNGSDLWILNRANSSVTEFSDGTGAIVRVIRGPTYQLSSPSGIAIDGPDVFVTNQKGMAYVASGAKSQGTVTEFVASTGALVRVIGGSAADLNNPQSIAADGADLWVVDGYSNAIGGGSVTELSSATGAVVRQVDAPGDCLSSPQSVAVVGSQVWVTNAYGCDESGDVSVTVLSAATGTLVRVILGGLDASNATGIAADGGDVWVIFASALGEDQWGNTIDEFSAATGALVNVIDSPKYNLLAYAPLPDAIAFHGGSVWTANAEGGPSNSGSITEFSATTGRVEQVIDGFTCEFQSPSVIGFSSSDLWAPNSDIGTVLMLPLTSASKPDPCGTPSS